MASRNPGCMGEYDFDHIAHFARRRFIEGCDTVSLMQQATSQREKEEIALVCLLDVEDETIKDINLSCRHANKCHVTTCRDKLRKMIEDELG